MKEQARNLERGVVNDVVIRMVGMSGNFRACRLCDVMPAEWFDTPFYHNYYQSCGHRDAVYVAFPVNEDAESYFGLFRATGQLPFTAEERDTLAYALRGIKWFHRQLAQPRPAGGQHPAHSRERRVLQSLMTGLAEKEIAAAQGRATTPPTNTSVPFSANSA